MPRFKIATTSFHCIKALTISALGVICTAFFAGCSDETVNIDTQQCYISINAVVSNTFTDHDGVSFTPAEYDIALDAAQARLTLTDVATGATHTWDALSSFDITEAYTTGPYLVSLRLDGAGYMLGADTVVTLKPKTINRLEVTLRPLSALVRYHATASTSAYTIDGMTAHSVGLGAQTDITSDGLSVVTEGATDFVAHLADSNDRTIDLVTGDAITLQPARVYQVETNLDNKMLTFSINGDKKHETELNDALFDMQPPQFIFDGFEADKPLTVTEGTTLSSPVTVTATSGASLKHFYLSLTSPILSIMEIDHAESSVVDLFSLTDYQKEQIAELGLEIAVNATQTRITLDLTRAIENMASLTSARSVFTLWVVDRQGRATQPLSLQVDTRAVSFDVVSVSHASIGDNTAQEALRPSLTGIEREDLHFVTANGNDTVDCPVTAFSVLDNNDIQADIRVPSGTEPVKVNVMYMGLERTSFTVTRSIPDFELRANVFTTTCDVEIVADNAQDVESLTRLLRFSTNGTLLVVNPRQPDNGTLTIVSLQPNTQYGIQVDIDGYTQLKTLTIKTEAAQQIPDGGFEDVVPSMFKYKGLPCGGRYSISPFDIPSRQNHEDIDFPWFKNTWASTNDLTFSMAAKHHNTWYIQPNTRVVTDAHNGYNSVSITSVGWDLNGETIPDYVPESATPVPSFSLVVPKVTNRSAGRFFLGRYTFNAASMTQTITEGIPFTSRPSSLNGFYKFKTDLTDTSDRGCVRVALVSRTGDTETTVAEGYGEFGPVSDFTAFNVPLTYTDKYIKPTHLKIMFMSSKHADNEPFVDVNVPVTANPAKGAMLGSTLWIDDLSFTY